LRLFHGKPAAIAAIFPLRRKRIAPELSVELFGMAQAVSPFSVEERVVDGDTVWVAIRARGAEWSWLTPAEAAQLGRQWVERYGRPEPRMIAAE
jgi:hypothetical protein